MSDAGTHRYPVSVKAVIRSQRGYILLRNERDEWELPGGKLEPGEEPAECLAREIAEEIGLSADIGPLIDCWVYRVDMVDVVIVTYGVPGIIDAVACNLSHEHKEIGFFPLASLASLRIPAGYVNSIIRHAGGRG
jgi:8-oxo-dGTP pyrophosphatase MutT (NUDIX family)